MPNIRQKKPAKGQGRNLGEPVWASSKEKGKKRTVEEMETPYERLYNKLQDKRKKKVVAVKNRSENEQLDNDSLASEGADHIQVNEDAISAHFIEDDNYVDMEVSGDQDKEFPPGSEGESESEEEMEDGEDGKIFFQERSKNNNSNVASTQRSAGARQPTPGTTQ